MTQMWNQQLNFQEEDRKVAADLIIYQNAHDKCNVCGCLNGIEAYSEGQFDLCNILQIQHESFLK